MCFMCFSTQCEKYLYSQMYNCAILVKTANSPEPTLLFYQDKSAKICLAN